MKSNAAAKSTAAAELLRLVAGPVKQEELAELMQKEEKFKSAKREYEDLQASIQKRISEGAPIEPGAYSAAIQETKGRRMPRYKDLLEQMVSLLCAISVMSDIKAVKRTVKRALAGANSGSAYMEAVLNSTEPGEPSRKLIVSDNKRK